MGETIRMMHEEQTDEEEYQMLKKNKEDKNLMDAEEWKKNRLIQLKKEGKVWSLTE